MADDREADDEVGDCGIRTQTSEVRGGGVRERGEGGTGRTDARHSGGVRLRAPLGRLRRSARAGPGHGRRLRSGGLLRRRGDRRGAGGGEPARLLDRRGGDAGRGSHPVPHRQRRPARRGRAAADVGGACERERGG